MSGRALRWLASLAHRPARRRPGRLTIVRHHRVYAASEQPLYRLGVSEAVLEQQLRLLSEAGLGPVTIREGLERVAHGEAGLVAMSFDDGYADNVERALPLLERVGGRATFFLTAGLIEQRRAPWWDVLAHAVSSTTVGRISWSAAGRSYAFPLGDVSQRRVALYGLLPALRVRPEEQASRLAELKARLAVPEPAPCELVTWDEAARLAEAGQEIGAHTLSHPFLSLLDAAEQAREIGGSVERIAECLGVRPVGLAYPNGDHDGASLVATRQAGLDYAVTTRAGDVVPDAPRFELPRRAWSEGACVGPGGRFSRRLARAELDGVFDVLRGPSARLEAVS